MNITHLFMAGVVSGFDNKSKVKNCHKFQKYSIIVSKNVNMATASATSRQVCLHEFRQPLPPPATSELTTPEQQCIFAP